MLVSQLRGVIDRLIERRIENPGGFDSNSSEADSGGGGGSAAEIIRLVTRLVEWDGLDA